MEKENVYVPEYPGKKVFEKYHGIPAEEFLQKTKEAIEQFIRTTNYTYTIKTARKTQRNIKKVFVTMTEDTIKIEADGSKYSIQPTKWGTDIVDRSRVSMGKMRIWLFDGQTLNDLNLICEREN